MYVSLSRFVPRGDPVASPAFGRQLGATGCTATFRQPIQQSYGNCNLTATCTNLTTTVQQPSGNLTATATLRQPVQQSYDLAACGGVREDGWSPRLTSEQQVPQAHECNALFAVRLIGLMLTILFIVVFNLCEIRTCLMVSFPSVSSISLSGH